MRLLLEQITHPYPEAFNTQLHVLTSMPPPTPATMACMALHTYCIRMEPGELEFAAAGDESILQAAERAGIGLASSCRNGTCRTCIGLMTQGSVRYAIEWPGLLAEEKRAGWILPCVAVATSDLTLQVSAL